MNCFPVGLLVMSLLDYVLGSLPTPEKVHVDSVNFHHVLRWAPAQGTPPGAVYRVYKRSRGKKKWKSVGNTTTTSAVVKLKYTNLYFLSVEASYNQTRSPMAGNISFCPYSDTIIGPPELSLAACGNCIQMNMSLLQPNRSAGVTDIHKIYNVNFRVRWKKDGIQEGERITQNKTFTLDNLQMGVEYCVQVDLKTNINKNTLPSSWKCISTSPVERRVVVAVVTAVLIVAAGILTTFVFFLCTGCLCRGAPLPRGMIMVLSHGYILTPEGTIPDPVSITSEKDKPRNRNNPMSPSAIGDRDEDEDEDEEEEEVVNNYMYRNAPFSSGESLCCNSANMHETNKPGGSFTDRLSSEVEAPDAPYVGGLSHASLDENETNIKVSTVPEGGQTEFKELVTGKKKEMEEGFASPCSVNLSSVTLAALRGGEEEEHNTRNFLLDDVAYRCAGYIKSYGIQHEEEEDDRCSGGYMAHT